MISIIIPSFEEKFLLDTVKSIKENTKRDYEIIVVSSSLKDDYIKDYGARLYYTKQYEAGEARNIGARNALGEVLVFMDAHVWVEEGWEVVTDYALKKDVGIVSSAIYVVDGNGVKHKEQVGYFPMCNKELEFMWGAPPPEKGEYYEVQAPVGCFHVIEKKKFLGLGVGYIPYWGYEDREIALRMFRLGYKNIVVPRVKVGHHFKSVAAYGSYSMHFYAMNYYIGALLDFDDDTLQRLYWVLRSKGVTKEIMDEVLADKSWLEWREYYLSEYKYKDTMWWKIFGLEPP
ncbi:MAG: glycosyltransferase family 2 protein [Candidatus Brockarchaeota archaeon]|nr:glycosyltransferase family 2 protein [Candidatus Brockarchaeota archaeon]